jgi:hypothetical protein
MYYALTKKLELSPESAERALNSLQNPGKLSYQYSVASKLISRQVKQPLFKLLLAAVKDVLQKLQDTLELGVNTEWAPCLSVILILCECGEMAQLDTDVNLVYKMHAIRMRDSNSTISRTPSIEHCSMIEDKSIAHCMSMFHEWMKSFHPAGKAKHQRGHNPLRHGVQEPNGAETTFIKGLQEILVQNSMSF